MPTPATTTYSRQISDAVHLIELPLPLPDLRSINCYAIVDGDGVTLVDPGWYDDPSDAVIRAALAELDATPSDVTGILVTHSHWDHYTRAIEWQQRYSIPVFLGMEEHHTIDVFDLADGSYPQQVRLLRLTGADDLAEAVESLPLDDHEKGLPFGPPDEWIACGREFACGTTLVRSTATPGHTRGHVVYEVVDDGLLLTGDHLLPRITPSLGFERTPEQSPLTSFLTSLEMFTDRADLQMLPAHGDTSGRVDVRARELLEHHQMRLALIRDAVGAGVDSAYAIATGMTWTRRDLDVTELGEIHAMTAVLEVRAHLEHLARIGEITKHDGKVETYVAHTSSAS